MKPRVILFSTLNPFPFWAGSENYWFDFVMDERVNNTFDFTCVLADSPVTRNKGVSLSAKGVSTLYYDHFNVSFGKRNLFRLRDKISGNTHRTLPWYNHINKGKFNLVWFNVSGLHDLLDLAYPVTICKKLGIPYWLILQHGFEDFFLDRKEEVELVTDIAMSARRFVFIAHRNKLSLERAICTRLNNSFHSVNALPAAKLRFAKEQGDQHLPGSFAEPRFFNLGRFSSRDKGQHLLMEVFSDPKWNQREWQLKFIGVSDYGVYFLNKLIEFYGIKKSRVSIELFTNDPISAICKNDILLMPSLAEGTPFAMVESMACGRPAVGTPIGGIPELIMEGKTGWMSRTTAATDISDAIENAWSNKSEWANCGTKAQQFVEQHYNQDDAYNDLLKQLTLDVT